MRMDEGEGWSSDWHGGFQGSENRSASVQTESYLHGGANKPNVRRRHFPEPQTAPPV